MVGGYPVYWICFFLEIKTSCKAYFSFAFELRAGEKGHLKNFKKTREDIGIY